MATPKTNTPAPASPDTAQAEAVASALGVTLTDAERDAYQLERGQDPVPAAAPAAGETGTPKPEDKTAGTGTPPAGDPAADGTGTNTDGEDPDLSGEQIAALLEGKPLPPKPADPAAAPAAPTEPLKTGNELLDAPVGEEVKDRTRERMEKLLTFGRESHTKIRDLSAEVEQLQPLAEQAHGWSQVVAGTGLQPEEFATVMGTLKYINHGTHDERRQALARIRKMHDDVATQLGEAPIGADVLQGHPDLVKMVEDDEIPRAQAEELALSRNRQKAQQTDTERRNQRADITRAQQQQIDEATQRLNDVGEELAQRDGLTVYRIRNHIALKSLRDTVGHIPPNQWEKAYRGAYAAVPSAMVDDVLARARGEAPAGGQPAQRRQTPIMSAGGAGGAGGPGGGGGTPLAKPRTQEEAVFAALGLPPPSA